MLFINGNNHYYIDIDEENFEFNPEEYIRKDIEGSGKLHSYV